MMNEKYMRVQPDIYRQFLVAVHTPAWHLFRALERGAAANLWEMARKPA